MSRTRIVPDADDDVGSSGDAAALAPTNSVAESAADHAAGSPIEVAGETEHYAGHLRDSTLSMFSHAAMAPFLKGIKWESFRLYRDRLLADCGGPTDPIEVMLIEQLSMAHLSLGLLSAKATNAGAAEIVATYSGAAARLMGEFRRSALALQAYRGAARQLAVGAGSSIVVPSEPPAEEATEKTYQATEMGLSREEDSDGQPVIRIARSGTA